MIDVNFSIYLKRTRILNAVFLLDGMFYFKI